MVDISADECLAKSKAIREAIAQGIIRSPEWHYVAEFWEKMARRYWLESPEPRVAEIITMRRTGRLVVLYKQEQTSLITPERNLNTLGVKNEHRVFTLTDQEFTEHNGTKVGLYLLPYRMSFAEYLYKAQPLFIDKKPAVYGRQRSETEATDFTRRLTKKPSVP